VPGNLFLHVLLLVQKTPSGSTERERGAKETKAATAATTTNE
jgi:hypothetical protein